MSVPVFVVANDGPREDDRGWIAESGGAGKAKCAITGLQRFSELQPAGQLGKYAVGIIDQALRFDEQRIAAGVRAIILELLQSADVVVQDSVGIVELALGAAKTAEIENTLQRILGIAQQEQELYFLPTEHAGGNFALIVQDLVQHVPS